MSVSSKKKESRKVLVVRIVCLVLVVLLVLPILFSTILSGLYW